MQKIWSSGMLRQCTGLNMIFFRAPSMVKWRQVDRGLRRESEDCTRGWMERIVRALEPWRVVMIGFRTFDTLTAGSVELTSGRPMQVKSRVLVKRGELWGTPAFGVIHLSGARIHRNDMARIKAYFATPVSS